MNNQLRQRQVPVLDWPGPAFGGFEYSSIKKFQQAILIGKAAFGFSKLTKLTMNRLYRIGGVIVVLTY